LNETVMYLEIDYKPRSVSPQFKRLSSPAVATTILLGRLLPDDSCRTPGTVALPPIGTCLSPRSDCPFHPDQTGSSLLL